MADTWEFYEDNAGEHRWRCTAANGEIVGAAHEGYKQKASATANAERHGYNGNPNGLGKNDTWDFYVDGADKHRWTRTAANGEVCGKSSQGYTTKSHCQTNAERNGM